MNSLPVWPIVLPLAAALLAVVIAARSAWIGVLAGIATFRGRPADGGRWPRAER